VFLPRGATRASVSHASYDYTRSTAENYATSGTEHTHSEEFRSFRAALDYSYHIHYTMERQETQDAIVRQIIYAHDNACETARGAASPVAKGRGQLAVSRKPWVLFTAGCMGAGKTHVMCALDQHGLLPLMRFVRVDIDRIRVMLPEMDEYVRRDPDGAGEATQKEAGMIAELATEVALARGLNVWIDSSMRNAGWWSRELVRFRQAFPAHHLAILHVSASWKSVKARERRRGEETGRRVPPALLRSTFHELPAAVTQLRPLVHEFIEIDNDADQHPTLKSQRDVTALLTICRDINGSCETRQLEAWLPPTLLLPSP
jgi:hypothetical protein